MTDEQIAAVEWEGRSIAEWQVLWRVPELHVYTATASTNDDARTLAENGALAATTVIADVQSAGRGQAGRPWYAQPNASVLMSVVLRPLAAPSEQLELGTIPIRIGFAVAHAIRACTDLHVRLKWPNDIVLPDGRKLAGVLCEGALAPGRASFVIAGIGINVLQDDDDIPSELRGSAASLKSAGATSVQRSEIAGAVLRELARIRGREASPLSEQELLAIREIDLLNGRPVSVDGHARGIADGLAPDGSLLARDGDALAIIRTGSVRLIEEVR
jgi:BirA family biotin operon repressor/biotin-[acetyl-CoA-carboxylase] ligase